MDRFRSFVAGFSTIANHLPTRSQAIASLKVAALWAIAFALTAVTARAVASRVDNAVIVLGTVAVAGSAFVHELHRQAAAGVSVGLTAMYPNAGPFFGARDFTLLDCKNLAAPEVSPTVADPLISDVAKATIERDLKQAVIDRELLAKVCQLSSSPHLGPFELKNSPARPCFKPTPASHT